MANIGELVVKLKADMKSLKTGLTVATRNVKGFAKTTEYQMKRVASSIARVGKAFLSLGGLISNVVRKIRWYLLGSGGLVAGMVKLSMNAEETENFFTVAMGKMEDAARAWSVSFSQALKLNDVEVRKNLSTYHLMVKNMGVAEDQALEMSKSLTALTYDMASLRNMKFDEAFTKISAAISGETEPLKRIGINMNVAAIEAWALNKGLIQQGQELTELEKVYLRVNFLMEKTAEDQGDMAATAGSLTNTLRSLWDTIKLVGMGIGDSLKPAILEVATVMRDWLWENRTNIARWAAIVTAHITYIKDLFMGFVDTLRKSPKEGFGIMMSGLLEVIKAAGELAISMAVRIGEGIWQGVKQGVMGGGAAVRREAWMRYLDEGGKTSYKRRPGFMGTRLGGVTEAVPADSARFQAIQNEIRAGRTQGFTSGVMSGFGEEMKAVSARAGQNIKASSKTFTKDADLASAKLKNTLADIEQQFGEVQDAGTEAGTETQKSFEMLGGELEKTSKKLEVIKNRWTQTWLDVSGSIASGFETAFADITSKGADFMDTMSDMFKQLDYEIKKSLFRNYVMGYIFKGMQGIGLPAQQPGQQALAVRPAQYAAEGTYVPKGADTVPIMAAPGEGLAVLPKGMVNWLHDTYNGGGGAGGGAVNVNINAIDTQSGYAFLMAHKRDLASLTQEAGRNNHPSRRSRT